MEIFLSYGGIRGLPDKTAKLKIAKIELWTIKLGFVNCDDFNFPEVIEDKIGKSPRSYLKVRLKGTIFYEANRPDEKLLLTDLQNKNDIEMIIDNSILEYNEQNKVRAGACS